MADPYVYKGSNVLINIPNIKDQSRLDEYENAVVNLSILRISNSNIMIESTKNIFKIHKDLFGEIYAWAGKKRTINIYKEELVLDGLSVTYSDYKNILKDLEYVNKKYYNLNWKSMTRDIFISELARYISSIWKIHAFREGNTRTVATYLYIFLRVNNYNINAQLLKRHSKYFRNALVMASLGEYSEYTYLENILNDAIVDKEISTKVTKVNPNQYKKINGLDLTKYRYNYHQAKD